MIIKVILKIIKLLILGTIKEGPHATCRLIH